MIAKAITEILKIPTIGIGRGKTVMDRYRYP
jgi:ketopantoate hydroxymethyltransferase